MKLSDLGEGALVELITEWVGRPSAGVIAGPGDDAALLQLPDHPRQIVVSTDAWVEGVHFRRDWMKPDEIGHRAMAGSLSDLAAMAADPLAVFVSVHAPADTEVEFLRQIYLGMTRIADACGVSIAGGDVARGELALDITVIGSVLPGQAVRRNGAGAGDVICVSGELGRSEAGRRLIAGEPAGDIPEAARTVAIAGHRKPRPRFDVAALLRGLRRRHVDLEAGEERYEPVRPTAMMDVSDGLAVDLLRMCAASGTGCRLDADRIPVDAAAREIARAAGEPETALALGGGEDFELLFTMPAEALDLLLDAADRAGIAVAPIGRMVPAAEGCRMVDAGGRAELLRMQGWDHFTPKRSTPPSTPAPGAASSRPSKRLRPKHWR